jgi:GNAT superfamily N-acetyltransferase
MTVSPTMPSSLERQAFDEAAFDRPFYRVTSMDSDGLERGIATLRKQAMPFIVDAKTPSDDLVSSRRLLSLGFRKVCMQIRLVNDLSGPADFDQQAGVADTLDWPDELIAAHARNFVFDRFALDIALPAEGHDRLYSKWIRTSFTSGRKRILTIGRNFLSFVDDGEGLRIDLLSVLDHRQGIGRRLLNSLSSLAKDSGRASVTTVTECENHAAVQLYCRTGYRLCDFQAVFHLTEPS